MNFSPLVFNRKQSFLKCEELAQSVSPAFVILDKFFIRGEPSSPETPPSLGIKIEHLAKSTKLSINKVRAEIKNKVSRAAVGQIVKKVRDKEKSVS